MRPSRVDSGVFQKISHREVKKISEIQPTLPLTEFDFIEKYKESFLQSELGRIHELLPLKEMADSIRAKMPARKPQGNKPMFPPEGEIALMFLKSYTCMSDDALVEDAQRQPAHADVLRSAH